MKVEILLAALVAGSFAFPAEASESWQGANFVCHDKAPLVETAKVEKTQGLEAARANMVRYIIEGDCLNLATSIIVKFVGAPEIVEVPGFNINIHELVTPSGRQYFGIVRKETMDG